MDTLAMERGGISPLQITDPSLDDILSHRDLLKSAAFLDILPAQKKHLLAILEVAYDRMPLTPVLDVLTCLSRLRHYAAPHLCS